MSDLYQEILESSSEKETAEEKTNETIWLVFNAGENNYAIDSSLVQEVMRKSDCYPLPFVPKYIPGVLNSYGTPVAVVNLEAFLSEQNETNAESNFYLVLKDKNSVAFQVDDVQDFHNQSEVIFSELHDTKDSGYFSGTVSFDGIVAPVLNAEAVIEKVRKDIEAH